MAPGQTELDEDWTKDVFYIHVQEEVEKIEQSEDGGNPSRKQAREKAVAAETEPRDEDENGDEEKDGEEETNGEVEEAPTSIERMMSALDATRTALNAAQKSVKALNSLPFIIHFGSQKTRITTLESLNFFWNNVPDTPCLVCGENFDVTEWPLVRTVSFARGDPEFATHVPLRVCNRHLDCLRKENIKYYTVSHAWHEDIAITNGSGISSTEASVMLMEMLLHILASALVNLQGSDYTVEIWHDYFSVPQWNYAIKEKLLLHLPSIFSASTACLVHLDSFHSSLPGRLIEKPSDKDIAEVSLAFFDS
jgi:hypothetical protein